VCSGWIAGVALTFAIREFALSGSASLQSRTNFLTGCFLEWIGAAGNERREGNQ
jgi:hypothetical protein